jgi:argininosuccinate lyase
MMIDRLLHEEAGDVAPKLHTGRSRNDQVATATRLWSMDATLRIEEAIKHFQGVILTQAAPLENVVMPGYTHMQRAIPVSGAHWLLSHFWPLERDRSRLRAARAGAAVLPLGSGAIAGSAYPVSRVLLQGSLGVSVITQNSIDAVSDRDFVAEIRFQPDRMESALSSSMMATDLADYLVRKGATFRESHSAVGKLVRLAEDRGCELSALTAKDFAAAHKLFGADIADELAARSSVEHRDVPGGTGPRAVADQLKSARTALLS